MLTRAGKGFMHESFERDDPKKINTHWFAWANTLFGELVLEGAFRTTAAIIQGGLASQH
jgi:meiotically up-regulated gene 157 (Mug157) protein